MQKEKFQIYKEKGFNDYQIRELIKGYKSNLSPLQISKFFKREYTSNYMQQLRIALEDGLNDLDFDFLLNQNLDYEQLREIRICIEQNIDKDIISIISNRNFDPIQMRGLRLISRIYDDAKFISLIAKKEIDGYKLFEALDSFDNGLKKNETLEFLKSNKKYEEYRQEKLLEM